MKYRPLPTGSGLVVVLETVILLTACTVTILVGSVLENFMPLDSPWILLAALAAVTAGMVTGLVLDTVATAVLARTGHPSTPKS